MSKLIGISSLIAIVILSISAIPPDQTQPSALTLDEAEIIFIETDNNCEINCEIDPDFDLLTTVELPESYDSVLVQALDESEIFDISNVKVIRNLGEESNPISEINLSQTLSVVTFDGVIQDLSNEELSYTFQINESDEILFGSILIEYVINGESIFDTERYAIPSGIPENGLVEITTTPKTIANLVGTQTTGNVEIVLRVHELFVRNDGGLYSLLTATDIHTFNVALDTEQILYTNEEGTSIIIYPTDDKLVIQSGGSMGYGKGSCTSSTGGNCNRWSIQSWVIYPTADVGAIQVIDSLGNIVFSRDNYVASYSTYTTGFPSSYQVLHNPLLVDIEIQRNSQYTIKVGSPQNYEFTITTPKSQHNYHYTCDGLADICNFP